MMHSGVNHVKHSKQLNQLGSHGSPTITKGKTMENIDLLEGKTKGQKLIQKLQWVFMLMQARRDDTAAAVLQQVFDELEEIK